jgi:hypothetical protein
VVTSNDGCVMMMLKEVVGGNGVLWWLWGRSYSNRDDTWWWWCPIGDFAGNAGAGWQIMMYFFSCFQNTRRSWLYGIRCRWSVALFFPSWGWQWNFDRMPSNTYVFHCCC